MTKINENILNKYYIEYGKFNIQFEDICNLLRNEIIHFCTTKSSEDVEVKRIQILLEGLTATPILFKFYAIFQTSNHADNKELCLMMLKFKGHFMNIIEHRNFLSHSKFFPGDPHGDIDKFQVTKNVIRKDGFFNNTKQYSHNAFVELNLNVYTLYNFLLGFKFYKNHPDEDMKLFIFRDMKRIIEDVNSKFETDIQNFNS